MLAVDVYKMEGAKAPSISIILTNEDTEEEDVLSVRESIEELCKKLKWNRKIILFEPVNIDYMRSRAQIYNLCREAYGMPKLNAGAFLYRSRTKTKESTKTE